MKREEWYEITRDVFNEIFRKSAVKRTKFEGFLRNLEFIKEEPNNGQASAGGNDS
jgi:epoxyqueuosine reductase